MSLFPCGAVRPMWVLAVFAGLLTAGSLPATDVAFWNEYRPDKDDAEQTCLLLQFNAEPLAAVGPIRSIENVGQPRLVSEGRFGTGLQLDGRSALRCVPAEVFAGGQVSIETWLRLDRYPDQEGCVVFRPALVDSDARYDPRRDRSKGFSLLVDSRGGLHLETVNTFYGRRVRTSSEPGAVPLGRWVHVAGICGPARRLFVDGHAVADRPIHWGEGLEVHGDAEQEPQPIFVGNNDQGTAGLTGLIDQVRIHRNVHKFWPPEDVAWTDPQAQHPPVSTEPPHFAAGHQPAVCVPLDGSDTAAARGGVKVELQGGSFQTGVRGQAYAGRISVAAPGIFNCEDGSLECWLRPAGVNSLSDRNRSFVSEPFIFYLFNGGTHEPTLYFGDEDLGLHFVSTSLEFHPGRWYHLVFTWRGPQICIYVDGQVAGRSYGRPLINYDRRTADRFVFNGHEPIGIVDEIRIYDRALLPEEAANAYWRYRDPRKLTAEVRLPAVEIIGEYLPSERTICYELRPLLPPAQFATVKLELRRADGSVVQTWQQPWGQAAKHELKLPELADGSYALAASVETTQRQVIPGQTLRFYVRRFPWEHNTLGITDEVFPPFTPVQAQGRSVAVVSREMILNGFGLWDQVVSLGRELLAAPMAVRWETAAGPGAWTRTAVRLVSQQPKQAVFEGEAVADAVAIRTRSGIEIDGCMKVEMTLAPGPVPAEIKRLWIDVPLRDAEVPLLHTIGDGLRQNYAGAAPAGQGAVWDGSRVVRHERWRNAFVPYIWLGAAERGLAFFAENDKGWVTEKGHSKTPTHELVREGHRLTLRVYLINRPVTLTEPRSLTVGLQASPTKPLPDHWRQTIPYAPGGLAVVPWGGLQCASQGPYGDDWQIVEKILEPRRGLKFDEAWFAEYARRHHPPQVHGNADWTYYAGHFASRAHDVGPDRPLAVYQEEMRAAHSRPEWIVYQDEWKTSDGPQPRTQPDGLDLTGGHRSLSDISTIAFPRSYADFGTWIANEWLSRGVSLYWDNTYLYPTYNTRTSAAYLAEDGKIQPALTIWNVREYHQRVWHRLQQWRRERPEPLEWTLHMTNTQVLPVHTWGTVQLDHELGSKRPFSPEWLMTETIGRQTGNLPLSLYEVYGRDNEIVKALPKEQAERIEWGLRAVHEIQRRGPLEKMLTDFGYGTGDVAVHNYWEDRPVARVAPAAVKWLALAKPSARELLLVLASWSEQAVRAEVRLDVAAAGLADVGGLHVEDIETGQVVAESAAAPLTLDIPAPWGNRLLRIRQAR